MEKYIKRDTYLQKLIDRRENGDIKVITGPRRCGKSWLLKHIYREYLIADGVPPEDIIVISFDEDDGLDGVELTDKENLKAFLYSRITSASRMYYVFLDEVQQVDGFERIVNGLNSRDNVDVYVTGSNSKMLSKDINTIFRGRGDEVRVSPFSFREFCTDRSEPVSELWQEYYTYGGMPALLNRNTPVQKAAYLQRLWAKTYLSDVVDRNHIRNRVALDALTDSLCSAIGSLSNPNKIKNSLLSIQNVKIDVSTVGSYIECLEDAYLFEGARRYDIKGKRYYESLAKYYCVDVGLRNARLNFRQQEITHIMENVIYNELRSRDYLVDVGIVEAREKSESKSLVKQYEVDFIATDGIDKFYIQSAYALDTEEKKEQELRSLKKIGDSFRKIVILGNDIATYTDESGITYMGLFQFLKGNAKL